MNNKGFTMVEIIAVIALLGLIAVITTPAYNSISSNIKEKNYKSKKNTIESETLSYVERYLKDKVYDGKNYNHCFTIGYLIENGIINSDSEQEEYIINDKDNAQYEKNDAYVLVWYDENSLKLKAEFKENIVEPSGLNKLNDDCPSSPPGTAYIYEGE